MRASFAGRVAVITGASSGIGRALAVALGAEGCRVGVVARRREALEEVVGEIRDGGGVAAAAVADVGDRNQVRSALTALAEALGPADLLVANAGVGVPTTLEPVNLEAVEETIRVNVLGVIYATLIEELIRAKPSAAKGKYLETITLTTNTGITLSGTMTIAQNNSKRFLAVKTVPAASSSAAKRTSPIGTQIKMPSVWRSHGEKALWKTRNASDTSPPV